MSPYPANRFDWSCMSQLDDYIDARAKAQKMVGRIAALRAEILAFADHLLQTPSFAVQRMPNAWPSSEELSAHLSETEQAFRDMNQQWESLPPERREHTLPPLKSLAPETARSSD